MLKCIHQEIIFPAVCALRFSIYTVLPYKDVKGEWRVRVEVRALPIASQSHRNRIARAARLLSLCGAPSWGCQPILLRCIPPSP